MGRDLTFGQDILDYIAASTPPEPPLYRRLRAETAALGEVSAMQIGWTQAHFMQLAARMVRARRYLEIGVFTGYSTLAVADALPPTGRVVALDISEEWTAMGRRYWKAAKVEKKIRLVLGDARKTLKALERTSLGAFDLAFIDADKENLAHYFEHTLRLLRPGGVVMIDNVLWSGAVIDPSDRRESTKALRAFNRRLVKDKRVAFAMIPLGDGLTVALKK
jgi:predicted O-methyltransferase YrrM